MFIRLFFNFEKSRRLPLHIFLSSTLPRIGLFQSFEIVLATTATLASGAPIPGP